MKPVSTLAAAIELGKQGYACFPCRADKRPSCTHGFLDASTHDENLKALWSEFPGPLVGVATGNPSQIAVPDVDAKHTEAREWWATHRPRLPLTRTHRTRSGGLHLIFGDHDGLKCSASKIAKGVDVRANGGYAIWWPAAGCQVLSDAPIAPWPDDLLEALAEPASAAPLPPLAAPTKLPHRVPGDLRPALHRVLGLGRIVANAGEGERNRILFWATCRTREMIAAGELDQPSAVEVIEALHAAAIRAGLPNREAERTIKSAMRAA